MRRLVGLLLILFAIPAFAQYPEVDAAVEAFMAKDLRTLAKHLPPELEKGLLALPANEQKQLSDELIPSRGLVNGFVARRSESPDSLVTIEPGSSTAPNAILSSIKLEKRISDGSECLLQLIYKGIQDEEFQVWMKYVDSEWRVFQIEIPENHQRVDLSAPNFLAKIRHTDINTNESSAVGSMRSFNTAAIVYASSYPDIGFPHSADDLGVSRYGTNVDEHHAGLVDNILSTPPFEKSGYRFTFTGEKEKFTVTGRPIKFGVTGNRSFFSDERCVIRVTDEDREATAQDEPLR